MIQQHGKGIAGLMTSVTGAVVAWWPLIETVIRDVSGVAAIIASVYTALYFRGQWRGNK